jgi:signal transduction histidine kinase
MPFEELDMSFVNHRPRIRTLRARLTVLHVGTLALTLILFAGLAYQVLSRTLYGHHDDELAGQASDLVQALEGVPLTEANIRRAFAQSSVGSRFVMVRDNHGALLYRDLILQPTEPSLGEHEMLIHAAAIGSRTPVFFTLNLERSGELRFICAPLPGAAAYLQIGDPIGDVRATLRTIALAWLPLIPTVLLLSSSGGWWMARRALAPMRSITATLEEIHSTDLARRVEVHATDEEVSGLVATLNHLLDRLQRSFESLRQFAGDVSHQIQTPLTIMKGTLESALRTPGRPTGDRALLESLGEEVDDLSAIVADLREFALADAPVRGATTVDVTHLVAEAADIIAALGELRGVAVDAHVESGVTVRGDAVRLKQVVLNLGDNAVKYTPEGGRVSIRLRAAAGDAVLEVTDTGIGISAEHLPHLFDRLFRADAADRSVTGTGLGLAIAKRIVVAHRGTLEVRSQPERGSTFTVRLRRA